jgi:hypothetical protein
MTDDSAPLPPLKFSNEQKVRKQMRKRGWTDHQIREAMATTGIPAEGRLHSATRYVHPVTRRSVCVDDITGEIFHVGGEEYKYG